MVLLGFVPQTPLAPLGETPLAAVAPQPTLNLLQYHSAIGFFSRGEYTFS
jgi:hypothetical protein